jgi:hypothetical protein
MSKNISVKPGEVCWVWLVNEGPGTWAPGLVLEVTGHKVLRYCSILIGGKTLWFARHNIRKFDQIPPSMNHHNLYSDEDPDKIQHSTGSCAKVTV